jgi:putative addiction module killer protein
MKKNTFEKTDFFKNWLDALTDERGKVRIRARIENAEGGNLGDRKAVGEGGSEMRIHFGPGYRLYSFQSGMNFYWLLIGGDKSTQESDIELAKALKRRVQRGEEC